MTSQEIRNLQQLIYDDPPENSEQGLEWREAHGWTANFIALEQCALMAEHNELMVEWMKTAQPVPEEVAYVRAYLDEIADHLACAEAGEDILPSLVKATRRLLQTVAIIAGERREVLETERKDEVQI